MDETNLKTCLIIGFMLYTFDFQDTFSPSLSYQLIVTNNFIGIIEFQYLLNN